MPHPPAPRKPTQSTKSTKRATSSSGQTSQRVAPDNRRAGTDDTLAQYLRYVRVQKRLAERTCALYRDGLQHLQTLAAQLHTTPESLGAGDLRRLLAQLHGKGYSAGSLATTLSSWRGYYRWLGHNGYIAADPTAGVRAPKKKKPLPKALDVETTLQLVQYRNPNATPATESRDVLITELLYGSGLRIAELVGLDMTASATNGRVQHATGSTGDTATGAASGGYIDTQAAEVHVLGKGGKWRTVPVGKAALSAWRGYIPYRRQWADTHKIQLGHEQALLLNARGKRMSAASVWHMLKQRSLHAGLPIPVHPHMLRHSFASHILQSSRDLRAVQELLGHANIATTQIYTRLDFQHLAQTYADAHPRASLPKQPTNPTQKTGTDTDTDTNTDKP